MPKAETSLAFVDNATKCFATADLSDVVLSNQARAELAFVIVSCVVNVFDPIKKAWFQVKYWLMFQSNQFDQRLKRNERVNWVLNKDAKQL